MSGHLLIFAIDVIVVFSALLLAVSNVARFPHNRHALLVAAILVSLVCAVVLARDQYGYWIPAPYHLDVGAWEPLLNIGRNLGPGLFMLLCHSLFQERQSFPVWLLGLFAVQLLLEEPVHLIVSPDFAGERLVTEVLPALLEALFGGCAVYWTIAGWKSDLVETRRRLRWIVLVVIGLLMLGTGLMLRVLIPWDRIENYYANVAFAVLNAALLSAILLALLGRHNIEGYLSLERSAAPTRRAEQPAAASGQDTDAAAVARLDHLMNDERIYRLAGLSVASLARKMGMPEYRLRRLIHERLGYRNFNAFLHDYRIREACGTLRDPDQSRTPILTIALGVGYQSINTFNRGFREVMGVTPSAYRAGEPAKAVPGPDATRAGDAEKVAASGEGPAR